MNICWGLELAPMAVVVVACSGIEVCNYFRLEYTTPPVLVVEQSPTLLLYSSKLGHSTVVGTVGSTSTVITQASCLAST